MHFYSQLDSKYRDAVERPIVIIEGIHAKKLMKLLRQEKVARARIQRKVTARETVNTQLVYVPTNIYSFGTLSFFHEIYTTAKPMRLVGRGNCIL